MSINDNKANPLQTNVSNDVLYVYVVSRLTSLPYSVKSTKSTEPAKCAESGTSAKSINYSATITKIYKVKVSIIL